MAARQDLTGAQYHYLTVLGPAPQRERKQRNWECLCKCGARTEASTNDLNAGNKKSCGCLRREKCRETGKKSQIKLSAGESGFRQALRKYKRSAAERSLSYDLTEAEFRALTKANCHYCNREPAQISHGFSRKDSTRDHTAYIYNGIDRKDPTLGYTPSNCVTACSTCNWAKQDLSHDAFLTLVSRIHNNRLKEQA